MQNKNELYLRNEFTFCMHACGLIYDLMFTNSLEALLYWYSKGIRMFEIDIDYAGDEKFVACHSFSRESFINMEITNIPNECTYEWFKQQKLYDKTTNGITPMTLEKIFKLLNDKSDIVVMLDPKVYTYKETCLLLDKIKYYMQIYNVNKDWVIFETYNEDMIRAIRNYEELVNYQYCVDDEIQMGTSQKMRSWDIDTLINFLKKNNIWILSYPWKFAVENIVNLERFHKEGFIIFSKTRNDILADLLKRSGINVNIIDYLVTDEQREELSIYREEYYRKYIKRIDNLFGKNINN